MKSSEELTPSCAHTYTHICTYEAVFSLVLHATRIKCARQEGIVEYEIGCLCRRCDDHAKHKRLSSERMSFFFSPVFLFCLFVRMQRKIDGVSRSTVIRRLLARRIRETEKFVIGDNVCTPFLIPFPIFQRSRKFVDIKARSS